METAAPFARVVQILPYIAFAALYLPVASYLMDDAWIAFVYSRNLVETGSISFNGIAVEGYTSFLYVLLGALLYFISPTLMVPLLKALHLLLGWAVIFLASRIVLRVTEDRWMAWGCAITTAICPYLLYQFQTGLETPAVYLLLGGIVSLLIHFREAPLQDFAHWLFLLFFAGLLTRPDFAYFLLPVAVYLLWSRSSGLKAQLLAVKWWVFAVLVVAGIGYMAWRISFFGHFFPNPYYVKSVVDAKGPGFLVRKLIALAIALPLAAGIPLALWKLGQLHRPQGAAIILTAGYLFTFLGTNFWQDLYLRYFSPLIFLGIIAFFCLMGPLRNQDKASKWSFHLLIAITLALWVPAAVNYLLFTHQASTTDRVRVQLGKALNEALEPDAVLALGDAGAIPFHSQRQAIDFYFLNSAMLTHNMDSEQFWGLDTQLVYDQKPETILLTSFQPTSTTPDFPSGGVGLSAAMGRHSDFEKFELLVSVAIPMPVAPFNIWAKMANFRRQERTLYYQVYVQRGLPAAERLRAQITANLADLTEIDLLVPQ